MTRRRKKHIVCAEFNCSSINEVKHNIKKFLKALLSQIGLQYGIDYFATDNYLKIRHLSHVTGRVMMTLKEVFPVFNFYWKSPRMLVWF